MEIAGLIFFYAPRGCTHWGLDEAGDLLPGGLTHLMDDKFVPAVSWGSCFFATGCLNDLWMALW